MSSALEEPRAGWRIRVAFALFVVSMAWPLLVPLLPWLGVSGAGVAAFSGAMLVVAEVLLVVAAAVAGKEGFAFIKARVFGLLRSVGPPRTVGPGRYRLGLVMFTLPLLVGWATPYFGHHVPGLEANERAVAIGLDLMLLTSLFVLGGDFWDKLRSLFVHDATARLPDSPAERPSQGGQGPARS